MTKLWISVKTTLRSLVANGAVMLLFFIGFPIVMAGFMGFISGGLDTGKLDLKKVEINICDEDSTEMSKELVDFIGSEEIGKFIKISENNSADVNLTIPKGYEEDLLKGRKNNIVIEREDNGQVTIDTLKAILDRYHESIFINRIGGSQEELNSIAMADTIESISIDKKKGTSSYEYYAGSMLAFVITMLIYSQIMGGTQEPVKNLSKRILSTPITKRDSFLYDFVAFFVYSFILIFGYTFFFRITGIAFKGNIFTLLLIIAVAALLCTSIITFIAYVFGEKIASIFGIIAFLLPLIGMEMFSVGGNSLAKYSYTHYIIKIFNKYIITGGISGVGDTIITITAISLGLFLITYIVTYIKETLIGGRKNGFN